MQHRLAEQAAAEAGVDAQGFVRVADDLIALANQSNLELRSPGGVNLALLFGLARYGAYVGRGREGEDREAYIKSLTDRYASVLRAQFDDPSLK